MNAAIWLAVSISISWSSSHYASVSHKFPGIHPGWGSGMQNRYVYDAEVHIIVVSRGQEVFFVRRWRIFIFSGHEMTPTRWVTNRGVLFGRKFIYLLTFIEPADDLKSDNIKMKYYWVLKCEQM